MFDDFIGYGSGTQVKADRTDGRVVPVGFIGLAVHQNGAGAGVVTAVDCSDLKNFVAVHGVQLQRVASSNLMSIGIGFGDDDGALLVE